MQLAVGQGGFLLEVAKARGGGDYVIFRMVIKADMGTINFSYAAAIRIEHTDTRVGIRVFAPVFPSIQSIGLWLRTVGLQYPKRHLGWIAILASVQTTARNKLTGAAGVSGGQTFLVTRDDGRALPVIGQDYQ